MSNEDVLSTLIREPTSIKLVQSAIVPPLPTFLPATFLMSEVLILIVPSRGGWTSGGK